MNPLENFDEATECFAFFWLRDRKPERVKLSEMHEFDRWFRDPQNRWVRQTTVGPLRVSTIFLGVAAFEIEQDPVRGHVEMSFRFFETLVFYADTLKVWEIDHVRERYVTYEEAIAGHEAICEMVKMKQGLPPDKEEMVLH